MDVRKPLLQKIEVKMRGGEEDYYEVKYERPPLLCYHCGMLGHELIDYLERKENEEPIVNYGSWLKASP